MFQSDALHLLRERSRDLLQQLKRQSDKTVELSCHSRKRGREEAEGEEVEAGPARPPGRASRAAGRRPTVTFADTSQAKEASDSSSHSGEADEQAEPAKLGSKVTTVREKRANTRTSSTKSFPVGHGKKQKETTNRSKPQSDGREEEEEAAERSHRMQPLLGYDWIAGVLDRERAAPEHSDDFLNDLRLFRSRHKDECVHGSATAFAETSCASPPPLSIRKEIGDADAHKCTFSYKINSRLFPVPLQLEECCPICRKPKEAHPHTLADPALVRVSIPHTAVMPPYKYKPHRRCSFDASNMLGLPSHCLSGWSNNIQAALTEPSPLDLKSNLIAKTPADMLFGDSQDFLTSTVPSKQQYGDTSALSRMAQHQFQHAGPKKASKYYPSAE